MVQTLTRSYIANSVKNLRPSGIRRYFDIAATMDDVITLGIGEPDFVTPRHIVDKGIESLNIGNTAVTDLTPLRGMALRQLRLYTTKVADLSPLQGMKLELLHLSGTAVTDLSPLRGMPLTDLKLHECKQLADLSPLADCKELRDISLPPDAKNIEILRGLPKLERIGFVVDPKNGHRPDKTATEFWKECDAKKQAAGEE